MLATRRNFIIGSGAVAIAAAIPTIATAEPVLTSIIRNINQYHDQYKSYGGVDYPLGFWDSVREADIAFNTALITNHPNCIKAENVLNSQRDHSGLIHTRAWPHRYCYSMELVQNFRTVSKYPEKELTDLIVAEINKEKIDHEELYSRIYAGNGYNFRMLHYIPMLAVRTVNPMTFTSMISFKQIFSHAST
jgi:hypothetical protein